MPVDIRDSRAWAQERLAKANTIYEPDQTPWFGQLAEFAAWLMEMALLLWLALACWGPA
ncbi:MAG: hypothetical protein ACOZHQ_03385 [Thermodesulfobacteriota bacterium]